MSVNRLDALTATECKTKALKIPNGAFRGFAVIKSGVVRKNKSDVVDSREKNYYGHADIVHPIILKKGKPAPCEFNQSLKNMLAASEYFPDPNPASKKWEGEPLE